MSGETPPDWTGAHPPTLSRLVGRLQEQDMDILLSRSEHRGAPWAILTDRASYVAFPEAWLSRLVETFRASTLAETPPKPATEPPTIADVIATAFMEGKPLVPAPFSRWQNKNVPKARKDCVTCCGTGWHLGRTPLQSCDSCARWRETQFRRCTVTGAVLHSETGETLVLSTEERGVATTPLSTWYDLWFQVFETGRTSSRGWPNVSVVPGPRQTGNGGDVVVQGGRGTRIGGPEDRDLPPAPCARCGGDECWGECQPS